jgi:hypothetical protein
MSDTPGHIRPTVGRVMWFYVWKDGKHLGPFAAHVAKVLGERLVNLMVIWDNGEPCPRSGIRVVQVDEEVPTSDYVTWTAYQVGQAQKTEEALDRLRAVREAAEKGFRGGSDTRVDPPAGGQNPQRE